MPALWSHDARAAAVCDCATTAVRLLGPALLVLIVADAMHAVASSVPGALLGAALWGLHLGLAQGVTTALIADHAPAELRGTAFGLMHALGGIATLAASGIAGVVWEHQGASSTFVTGAAFAGLSLLLLPAVRRAG